jgi:hypothetical protein
VVAALGDDGGDVKDEEMIGSVVLDLWQEDAVTSLYLSWVQETLLKIIKEVLNQHPQ